MTTLSFEPMLCVKVDQPVNASHMTWQEKLDGCRIIVYTRGTEVQLVGRSGKDYTRTFPELAEIRVCAPAGTALDGEVVCLEDGRVSFNGIQHRIHRQNDMDIRAAARRYPALFIAFDMLALNGVPITDQPLQERRRLQQENVTEGPGLRLLPWHEDGVALMEKVKGDGGEGVVGKDLRSAYYPGKRSAWWVKVKAHKEGTFVVGGVTRGTGWREGSVGALLLGEAQADGKLAYVGSVGTGFDNATLGRLWSMLSGLQTDDCPFVVKPNDADVAFYTRPLILVEVEFMERSRNGLLRMPVYKRLAGVRKEAG